VKRLWIACGILLAIFAAALFHANYVRDLSAELTDLLTRAETEAEAQSWDAAAAFTQLAYQKWQDRDAYLHIMFRHSDTDEIYAGFHEVREFIQCQKAGEYSAANARLISRIRLLYEEEQLTLKNIL